MVVIKITDKIFVAGKNFSEKDLRDNNINNIYIIPGPTKPSYAGAASNWATFSDCLTNNTGYVENPRVTYDELKSALGATAQNIAFNSVMDDKFRCLIYRADFDGVEYMLASQALSYMGLTREDINGIVWK